MASLYEQNSSVITTFIKSTLGKTLLGIVALLIAAAGITVPMCAIDNTNELQDEWIYAVEAKADANASAITANARAIEALNTQLGSHLETWATFFNENEATPGVYQLFVDQTNAAIEALNIWLSAFYNDDPAALGEWQEFMETWGAFYNKGFDSAGNRIGEFQREIDKLYSYWATWYNAFNNRLIALETE